MEGEWDNNIARAWKYIVPPARPALSELVIFDEYLSKFDRGSRMLILGSTPEFRDLGYLHKFSTSVVDYNEQNFHILKEQMKHPSNEKLIVGDWREMDFKEEFDIVLGDLSLNYVPVEDRPVVFENIRKALARDGVSLQRMWTRKDGVYDDFDKILKERFEQRAGMDYFYSLAMPLLMYFYNEEKGYTQSQDILGGLKKAKEENKINEELFEAFDKPWHDYKIPHRLVLKEEFERAVEEYFTVSVEYGKDHFSEYCPIYVLNKN